jgi:L-fucose mutarotase
MLEGIPALLNADVLLAPAAMGHGDDLIVVDANFPGEALARRTTLGRLLRMDAATAPEAVAAVLVLIPLDGSVDDATARMEVVGAPAEVPPVVAEMQRAIDAAEGRRWPMVGLERFAFCASSERAFAAIQTGERRFYGNAALKKRVVPPAA